MRPFDEAWISNKGELFHNAPSHFSIGTKLIRERDPELAKTFEAYTYDEQYTRTYEYMWANGYGRLYGCGNVLYFQTSKEHPQYRVSLLRHAKKYVKDSDYFNELLCDDTSRTLWSKKDIL